MTQYDFKQSKCNSGDGQIMVSNKDTHTQLSLYAKNDQFLVENQKKLDLMTRDKGYHLKMDCQPEFKLNLFTK